MYASKFFVMENKWVTVFDKIIDKKLSLSKDFVSINRIWCKIDIWVNY